MASERSSQLESYLYENYFSVKRRKTTLNHSLNEWPYPIPVLVFVCNRALAIKHHLDKLLKYRSSADKFPIIVSQDCDDKLVTNVVKSYGNSVNYIKHLSGEKVNISTAAGHRRYLTYYRIARHYRLGLTYVFDHLKYSSVIITEDDLDIAPDFFNYFSATRYLLDRDPSLFCISAWNDNGKLNLIDKEAAEVLYRSDFFPGLGWMMSSDLWKELGPIWPSGFWDDWIRDPLRRKDRACIRPEISRTGMTKEGQDGASNGLFFNKHLARIAINQYPVDFTAENLDYLLKENYDKVFLERVYSAEVITTLYLSKTKLLKRNNEYRIEYSTIIDYLFIAEKLQIMRDFKVNLLA
ncbi:unnamed protein product [Dracunculus medinensis]|uniref:Alpha-1,3-mannosyl-glycoprotein 2-beta-N-acetylglucosaminyltransferase n=1 Tax=Dracunculus medinensis TaxID=318479 RepID=A0A3P7Q5X9_DRAME|nr:unnamed protein product [Dracunculus medinensis]